MNKLIAAVALATIGASGCFTANANLPGTLRNDVDDKQAEGVGRVEIEKTHYYFILGLVNAPPPGFLGDELKTQVKQKGGNGVRNLTYEAQFGCLDLVITQLTLGCVAPRTYKVSGEIVKLSAPPVPGKAVVGVGEQADDANRVAQKF